MLATRTEAESLGYTYGNICCIEPPDKYGMSAIVLVDDDGTPVGDYKVLAQAFMYACLACSINRVSDCIGLPVAVRTITLALENDSAEVITELMPIDRTERPAKSVAELNAARNPICFVPGHMTEETEEKVRQALKRIQN